MRPATTRKPIKRGGGAPHPVTVAQLLLPFADQPPPQPERRPYVPYTADYALSARARISTRKRAEPPPPPPPPSVTVHWRWIWKSLMPERTGQRFRVASMLTATKQVLIEFDDGARAITGIHALVRRWS